jgi:hypothetical protein
MAYPPTQISISYSGGPTVLPIPTGSNYSDFVKDIFLAGGLWTVAPQNAPEFQTQTFVPWSAITSIVAS